MKKIFAAIIVLAILIITMLFITRWKSQSPEFESLDHRLQYLISDFVNNDKSVKNCVVAVVKGDGSFYWSGAAGIADGSNQTAMSKDTPFFVASITKLFTASAIMILYEKEKLDIDEPISKYLPEKLIKGIHVFEEKDYSHAITIRHLLSHTSGIADYYYDRPKGEKNLFEIMMSNPERDWSVEETIERARINLKPHFAPGTEASYSDTNYQLLGKIIEKITGKRLHNVFNDFFFKPLNLKHTWLVKRSKPSVSLPTLPADVYFKDTLITKTRFNEAYWADGGIISTAEDCIIFLKALKEGRIIKPETLALMHQWRKLHFPLQYGYGTMYVKFPRFMRRVMKVPPLWGHSGSTGSFLYYSSDLDLYLAGTINQTESPSKPFRLMGKIINAIEKPKSIDTSENN